MPETDITHHWPSTTGQRVFQQPWRIRVTMRLLLWALATWWAASLTRAAPCADEQLEACGDALYLAAKVSRLTLAQEKHGY